MITIPNPSKADTVTLYDMNEAAEALGISYPTIQYHLKEGNLQVIRIGRKNLFTRAILDAFQATRRPAHRPSSLQAAGIKSNVYELPPTAVFCSFCCEPRNRDDKCGCELESNYAAGLRYKLDHNEPIPDLAAAFLKWYENPSRHTKGNTPCRK